MFRYFILPDHNEKTKENNPMKVVVYSLKILKKRLFNSRKLRENKENNILTLN